MELRKVDFKEGMFECGGRTFYLQDSLSFNRFRVMEHLAIEFGLSRDFAEVYKDLKKLEGHLQTGKNYVDAAVLLSNIIGGVALIDTKDAPALRMCALFINEKDEDTTVYDEMKEKDKIACWGRELDVSPFFHLAASLVDGYLPAYRLTLKDGFQRKSELKESQTTM
jgi:hypothetical protein